MLEACAQRIDAADIVIYAAAVADYRPAVVAAQKIKKSDDSFQLDLVKTTDIAASLSKRRHKGQIIIGFALETNDEIINAKAKLHKKNFDFIVINSLKDEGAGFQHDTNKISIIDSNENLHTYALKSKALVAKDIINHLITIMQKDKNV
jgi:phosphopantothenoylcysteine decarboxylase/phosphopantothenate--cysteine ligase